MSADREQEWQRQIAEALDDLWVLAAEFDAARAAAAVLPVLEAAVAEERAAGQELLAEQQRWANKLHDRAQKEMTAERDRVLDEAIAAVEDPVRRTEAARRENRGAGLGWEAARAVLREMRAGGGA